MSAPRRSRTAPKLGRSQRQRLTCAVGGLDATPSATLCSTLSPGESPRNRPVLSAPPSPCPLSPLLPDPSPPNTVILPSRACAPSVAFAFKLLRAGPDSLRWIPLPGVFRVAVCLVLLDPLGFVLAGDGVVSDPSPPCPARRLPASAKHLTISDTRLMSATTLTTLIFAF
eukprot:498846-Rhodomonas_salina.4